LIVKFRNLLFLGLVLLPLTGCVYRTHTVRPRVSPGNIQQATLQDLVQRIDTEAAKIRTLNATVDIATSVGGAKKGKVKEYQEIRGYILLRQPDDLRMIGLAPVVRTKLFDMVSTGELFRLSIPPKNKFVIGRSQTAPKAPTPDAPGGGLANLRPQQIMEALLVHRIDPNNEIAVLEAGSESVQDLKTKKNVELPTYVIDVIHRYETGEWSLARKISFSRVDLLPHKQVIFDRAGNVVSTATYDNFSDHDGVQFPNIIQIDRPQEEYSIQIGMVKLRMNEPLTDAQFELPRPPGSQLQVLDNAPTTASSSSQP